MRRFDIRPKRKLGQNFLVDNNILELIAVAAHLKPTDTVLEIGGGLGVLSEYLAARAAHVHVIEIDKTLEPALQDALAPHLNTTLHFADAVNFDLAALDPLPNKLIANLPYGVAASSLIKSFEELDQLELACVMAQREVAQRLAAAPRSKLYGATSVLIQLRCDVLSQRRLSRNIFYPVPNVDSSLIVLQRQRPNPGQDVIDLVHNAFAHRRKPLAGSVAIASADGAARRDQIAATMESIGLNPKARAEELSPDDFLRLAQGLSTDG